MYKNLQEIYQPENYAFLRALWKHNFVSAPVDNILIDKLPKETQELLSNVGLPLDETLNSIFAISFERFPQQFTEITFQQNNYLILGRLGIKQMALDALFVLRINTEEVFSLYTRTYQGEVPDTTPIQFYNSGLKQFLIFCAIYQCYYPALNYLIGFSNDKAYLSGLASNEELTAFQDAQEARIIHLTNMMEQEYLRIDKHALSDSRFYWYQRLVELKSY